METTGRRAGRWLTFGIGTLVVLVGGALVALDFGIGGRALVRVVAARTRHPIEVRGPLHVRILTRRPRIEASDVTIGNPAWMPPGQLALLDHVVIAFAPSIAHPLAIAGIELRGGRLHPQRQEDGAANWALAAPKDPPKPAGAGLPALRALVLTDLHLRVEDAPRHLDYDGTIATASRDEGRFGIDFDGQLNGRAVSAKLSSPPLAEVRARAAWPFHFEEQSSGTTLVADGTLPQPFRVGEVDARFETRGASLGDLRYLVGARLPETGRYQLSGRFRRDGLHFEFADLKLTSGVSDVSGTITLDSSQERPTFDAHLQSTHASLRDIGKGAAGRAPPRSGPRRLFADWEFPVDGLRRRDGVFRFEAKRLDLGPLTLADFAARLTFDQGVLTADPVTARTSKGSGDAHLVYDARGDSPHGTARIRSDGLDIGELLPGKGPTAAVTGPLHGVLSIDASGRSFDALFARGSGRLRLAMAGGELRSSLAKLLELDVRALGLPLVRSEDRVAIRCALVEADAVNGKATLSRIVIDTEPVVLTGGGTIALDSEAADFTLTPAAKRVGLRLRSSMHVTGSILDPSPRLELRSVGKQAVAATALGALLTPLAAAAAFVDPGRGKDQDCAALLAAVRD